MLLCILLSRSTDAGLLVPCILAFVDNYVFTILYIPCFFLLVSIHGFFIHHIYTHCRCLFSMHSSCAPRRLNARNLL